MKYILFPLFFFLSLQNVFSQINCTPLVLNKSLSTIVPNNKIKPEKYISYLLQKEFYFHILQHDSAGHYLPEITKWYAQNGKKELPEWEGVYSYVQGRAIDGTDKLQALGYFQRALRFFREKKDKAGEINALLAISQLNMNNYGERSGSMEYLLTNAREAIKLAQEINCIELELRAMSLKAARVFCCAEPSACVARGCALRCGRFALFRWPAEFAALAEIACREHLNVHRLHELRPDTLHDLVARADGFRKPERIGQLALVCEADKRGRLDLADSDYPQAAMLRACHDAMLAVSAGQAVAQGLEGPAIGEWLRRQRIAAVAAVRGAHPAG